MKLYLEHYLAYTFGAIASGFIGDYVWEDLNRNGVQEDGEPGLAGVQVSLHTVDGALLETIITNESGKFAFDGVPPGRYYLSYVPPVSYLVTLPGQGVAALNSDVGFDRKTPVFTLGTNDIEFGIDAGFYRTGTVGDYVWLDANGDGIQNDGEVGVPNVRIQLLDANGELLASTVSDQTGFYNFTNIPPGDYIISFTMPEGYGYAPYKATLDIELDSDIDPLLGTTEVIALKSSEIRMNVDIGLSQECDYVASFDVLAPECGTTNGSISISINGDTGPYSFNWANGESTQVLSGLDTGLCEVVVTDTNGCNRALSIRVDYEQECELQCVNLDVQVFLEGPYDPSKGEMNTDLNELGYLPGQRPLAFFGIFTDPGQPYSRSPYSYFGVEGVDDEAITTANNNDYYPETTVDWVLVSLRVAQDEEYETCTRAGLLQKDGTIIFDDDSCCQVDPTKQYYVVIEHRNHLIIMSPTVLPVVNNTIKYDFRTNPSYQRLFGFSQKSMGDGVLAMYASNGDQYLSSESPVDINVSDLSEWLKENGDNSSYYFMDFDLNGDANVQDKGLYLDNIGVFTDVPKTRQ